MISTTTHAWYLMAELCPSRDQFQLFGTHRRPRNRHPPCAHRLGPPHGDPRVSSSTAPLCFVTVFTSNIATTPLPPQFSAGRQKSSHAPGKDQFSSAGAIRGTASCPLMNSTERGDVREVPFTASVQRAALWSGIYASPVCSGDNRNVRAVCRGRTVWNGELRRHHVLTGRAKRPRDVGVPVERRECERVAIVNCDRRVRRAGNLREVQNEVRRHADVNGG